MENESPLKKYSRQPKIYINLPSGGKFYNQDVLYGDTYTELAVYSMTANDEILYKTPDALINGRATAEAIKSCIPSVLKPFELVTLDVDAILLAMRLATQGQTMTVGRRCKHCQEDNQYDINIQKYIDYYNTLEFDSVVIYEDFKVNIIPLTYGQYTELQKESVGFQRALAVQLPKIEDQDEKDKAQDTILNGIARLNLKTILLSIESIEIEGNKETSKTAMVEFIENYDVNMFKAIKDHIDKQYRIWQLPLEKVSCAACNKENELRITVDQTDFFGRG
jgi:hypothetical protein|tara:strand:+ start:653 stop:1489 length:837 start_codon:yes stop_codon:yes gene_type:complete